MGKQELGLYWEAPYCIIIIIITVVVIIFMPGMYSYVRESNKFLRYVILQLLDG